MSSKEAESADEEDGDDLDLAADDVPLPLSRLLIVPPRAPVHARESVLLARFSEIYHLLQARPNALRFWQFYLSDGNLNVWYNIFKSYASSGVLDLLVGALPPTAAELAALEWNDQGFGVYVKYALSLVGKTPLVYLGSAMGIWQAGSIGFIARRTEHLRQLLDEDYKSYFENIVRPKRQQYEVEFSTLFRLPIAFDATGPEITSSRIITRFLEALVHYWCLSFTRNQPEVSFWSTSDRDFTGANLRCPLEESLRIKIETSLQQTILDRKAKAATHARNYLSKHIYSDADKYAKYLENARERNKSEKAVARRDRMAEYDRLFRNLKNRKGTPAEFRALMDEYGVTWSDYKSDKREKKFGRL